MLLKDTSVPDRIVQVLQKFNIRTVEQLLSSRSNNRRMFALAEVLELSRDELSQLIRQLQEEYPELLLPSRASRRYATGYSVDDALLLRSLNDLHNKHLRSK